MRYVPYYDTLQKILFFHIPPLSVVYIIIIVMSGFSQLGAVANHIRNSHAYTHANWVPGGRRGVDNRSLHVLCRIVGVQVWPRSSKTDSFQSKLRNSLTHIIYTRHDGGVLIMWVLWVLVHTHTRSFNNNSNNNKTF